MPGFLAIFNAVAPTGLAVLSEVKGRGKQSKRQRIVFGVRVMQILAILTSDSPKDHSPARIGTARALCLQTISDLGPDVREAILKGYKEAKAPAPVSDDDITKAL